MENTLHKNEIIKEVAKNTHVPKYKVNNICKEFENQIIKEVSDGNIVHIAGFGKFYSSVNKEHLGYDFNSGKQIPVPESKFIKFKPSLRFKRETNKNSQSEL